MSPKWARTHMALVILAMALLTQGAIPWTAGQPCEDMAATGLSLTPRDSISIFEAGDFTAENGVVSGSGSSSDPYIIEGWELVYNGSGTGITVVETDKYFIVRNVYITGAKIGMRFEGVYHARVTQCVIENCSLGFSAAYSEVSKIDNNLIANCSIGISMRYCDAFKESDNTFVNNGTDLRIYALPWIETRQADMVFAIIVVCLAGFVVVLLYFRFRYGRPPEEMP